ncbi:MAG: hypothetical protein QXO27_04620 [Candidatus Aenigmatarchaeota archaeon]
MNMKIIASAVVLVIIVLVLILTLTKRPAVSPTVSTEEENILSDQINFLTDEQLASISIDVSDFDSSTENDIAQDDSLFMYQ